MGKSEGMHQQTRKQYKHSIYAAHIWVIFGLQTIQHIKIIAVVPYGNANQIGNANGYFCICAQPI